MNTEPLPNNAAELPAEETIVPVEKVDIPAGSVESVAENIEVPAESAETPAPEGPAPEEPVQEESAQAEPVQTEPAPLSASLRNIVESLLFVARKPLSLAEIRKAVQQSPADQFPDLEDAALTAVLEELLQDYNGRGINIIKVAGGYLMGTAPVNASYVHNLLHAKVQTTLSPQALEVLAIIAYKQPVTRAELERIRGVNSDGPLDTLLHKKLIDELGRSDAVGRPYLYGTTTRFLRHFGLKDLSDLPPLPVSPEDQEAIFKTALQE
jgi:segregation and condensation protein B